MVMVFIVIIVDVLLGVFLGHSDEVKLFVGNLHPEITQVALQSVFSIWGQVVNVHVKKGKSKFGSACAFVELARPALCGED